MYLNGAGIYSFHEAWRHAKNAQELHQIMEGRGDIVVNSDSTNVLFYRELREEFPEAKFVRIVRPLESVRYSIEKSYGPVDLLILSKWYSAVCDAKVDYEIDYDKWTPDVSWLLWKFIGGKWLDPYWHETAHDMKIELSQERVCKDHILSTQTCDVDHIAAKLRG